MQKQLLANNLALLADAIYKTPIGSLTTANAWIGNLAYALQVYFDFAGYSDMGIGMGLMFGFHFLENFNYPYIATSIGDFWRRWHISMSTWFRDYLYIPLGGSRVSRNRWIFNMLVVWGLTGLWHGAKWTYIVWGLCFAAILIMEKLTGFEKRWTRHMWLRRVYTLGIVFLTSVIIRADSLTYRDRLSGPDVLGRCGGAVQRKRIDQSAPVPVLFGAGHRVFDARGPVAENPPPRE